MNTEEKLKKIKELADKMYSRMAYLTSDTRPIREAMDEYHQFLIYEYYKEEPTIPDIVDEHFDEMRGEEIASEELEEAAKTYAKKESHGYEPCNIVKTFKVGANWQKQQMMKNAVEVRIRYINSDICAFSKEFTKYMDGVRGGSKVKLIIIKED